jgi:hypothetical protein
MPQATIRYVSVSDPAPLPRLGEVFFDVRGNSRSMRLSWYADTGVAVFSIWQAGMCTGTFRLPMADLSRMIGILERGPAPQGRGRPPVSASRQDDHRRPEPGDSDWYYGPGGDESAPVAGAGGQGGYGAERAPEYGRPGRGADYGRGERGPADYGAGGYGDAGQRGAADLDVADYEPGGGYSAPGYGGTDRADDTRYRGDYGPAGQPGEVYPAQGYRADYGPDQFTAEGGYRRGYEEPGYEQAGYEQPGYGPGGYAGTEAEYGTDEYAGYPQERRGRPDRGYPGTDDSGYHDERLTAPYVADGGQTYPNDNPDPRGGYPGEIGDPAYPADRRRDSRSERYPEPSVEEAYSYGADYRRR